MVIRPKLVEPILPFGLPKFAWLKTLKNSDRNSMILFSPIFVRFIRVTSKLISPGPWNTFRPKLPNRPPPPANEAEEPTRRKNGLLAAVPVPPPVPLKAWLLVGAVVLGPREVLVLRGSKNWSVPPTKSGRSLPAPVSERSVGSVMLNGSHVSSTVTPLICHPPKTFPANPDWLLWNGNS